MSIIGPTVPALGWTPAVTDVRVINRRGTDILAGELVTFDWGQSASGVTSILPGGETSVYANVITPRADIATFDKFGVYGVAIEGIGNGLKGRVRLRGPVDAFVFRSTSGAVTKGAALGPVSGNKVLSADSAAGRICIGIQLEVTTSSALNEGTAEKVAILFNGVEGFGSRQ